MIRYYALLLILVASCTPSGIRTPLEDLASPVQAVRDDAALVLRKSYQSTTNSKWLPIIEKIKDGQTRSEILELLRPFNVTPTILIGSVRSYQEEYRLDDEWVLDCNFRIEGDVLRPLGGDERDVLIHHELVQRVRHVWLAPPKNFTGIWITYFINGQKSNESSYKDGRYFGEVIAYHSNGMKKSSLQRIYEKANGENTGYYPSGKIAYQGQYKDGEKLGTWIWYEEDGSVTSTKEYPKP